MNVCHQERFAALAELLNANRTLIEERPFTGIPVAWERDFPELSKGLRGLSMDAVARYENCPSAIPEVREACPDQVGAIEKLTTWPSLHVSNAPMPEMPRRVRHRKWAQIAHFVSATAGRVPEGTIRFVDWCSGKGHLAGELNHCFGVPVTCIEKNRELCESGAAEAEIRGRSLDFVCRDVLEDDVEALLDDATAVTALHACGHLNVALFRRGVKRGVPFFAVAPCCYQRIDGMVHHPLSQAATRHPVPLTRHLLRLPALSDHRPSELKRGFRQRQHAFRLGLDLLVREATGNDEYLPLGKIPPALIRQDFEAFAREVSREKAVPLPRRVSWKAAEQAGWRLFHLTSALGLARSLFGRAIESWLLLDRVLYLEESGYRVEAGTFCDVSLSPRNLMILGWR